MRTKLSLSLGIICALISGVLFYTYTQNIQNSMQEERAETLSQYGGEQVEVCIATRPLAAGEKMTADLMQKHTWLVDLLPKDVIQNPEEVIGQTLASPILEGEPISKQRFSAEKQELSVPENSVALSLPAQDVRSVGGALTEGMKVDVYATGKSESSRILNDALVLATSLGSAKEESSQLNWITLAVDPERVEEIVEASHRLELCFVLPNPDLEKETKEEKGDE